MPTRDLANGRVRITAGLGTSISNLAAPALAQANALLNITEAVRIDGYDIGVTESDQTDDRSFADNAGATIRSFSQFGGTLPIYAPKKTDTGSIVRQTFNLLKTPRTEIIEVERIGFKDWNAPFAAGDDVNVYRLLTDAYAPDAEGDGGLAVLISMLPVGDVYPWAIIPPATPVSVTVGGGATVSGAAGTVALRSASYQGKDITSRAQWLSSNPAVASVDAHGVISLNAAGTANITAGIAGGTTSTAVAVTVT